MTGCDALDRILRRALRPFRGTCEGRAAMHGFGTGIAAGRPNHIIAVPPNFPLRGTEFYMPHTRSRG